MMQQNTTQTEAKVYMTNLQREQLAGIRWGLKYGNDREMWLEQLRKFNEARERKGVSDGYK